MCLFWPCMIFKFYFDLFDPNMVAFPDVILPLLYTAAFCIVLTNCSFSPQTNVIWSLWFLHLNHTSLLLCLIISDKE